MKKRIETNSNPTTLDGLRPGSSATLTDVPLCDGVSSRLSDLGFRRGVRIECVLESPLGDPRAYRVRGAVIALRRRDAAKIGIEK